MIQVEGLTDRVAVVTGAGRGIGQRIAEVLAGNGAKVAALDLVAPSHDGILGIACDVSDEAAIEAAFAQVEAELGSVASWCSTRASSPSSRSRRRPASCGTGRWPST